MLLTIASAATKICGLLFKIPLVSVIGEEGMGYFGSAYVIYTFFYVLSTSGLPVGLSILVAGSLHPADKKKYLYAALFAFGTLGLACSLLMVLFPHKAAQAVDNPGAAFSIAMMGPTLLFVCLSGALRGYFQGEREMLPTAVSQMIEAVMKMALGILFAYAAVRKGYGPDVAAAQALLGVCIGSALSLVYLLCCYGFRHKGGAVSKSFLPRGEHYNRLLKVVIPVGAASMVMSITSLIDLSMVMRRLQWAGFSSNEANRLYGCYSGLVVPLFNLPPVLIAPVASAVIPYLATAIREKENERVRKLTETAIRLALILSLPCAVGLAILAKPILRLLFGDQSALDAAPLLCALAPSVVFVAIQTVSGAVLQGSGRKSLPVISIAVGSFVKLISGYFLIGRYGMIGAPVGTFLCYFSSAFLNLIFCRKYVMKKFPLLKGVFLPVFCSALCGGAAAGIYRYLSKIRIFTLVRGAPAVLIAIVAAVLVYAFPVLLFGGFDSEMALLLPGIKKLRKAKEKPKHQVGRTDLSP